LALFGILSGMVALLIYRDRVESGQWRKEEEERVRSREAVFARGQLGEMLELCSEGWGKTELSLHHEPVALAWTPKGIDAYIYQGADESALRQVRCDAGGVFRGPRVAHPLHELLPAEASSESGARVERGGEGGDLRSTRHVRSPRSRSRPTRSGARRPARV
jgi:hypothetical protein